MKTKKRPCDCKDQHTADKLKTQGISHNEYSLGIKPAIVEISHKYWGEVRIPMTIFKRFAEWYLEEQELTD